MPDYLPVTVEAARRIADAFEKDVVVIFTIDRAHALAHYTTFGRTPADKLEAAAYGDTVAQVISAGRLGEATVFEDFRLEAAKNKAHADALLGAAEALLAAEEQGYTGGLPDGLVRRFRDAVARAKAGR